MVNPPIDLGATRAVPGTPWGWRDTLLLAVLIVPFLCLVHHLWFYEDDAYITYRYAWNWASGNGLRFNLGGQPVEGYSSFLWVAISALFERLGLDVAVWTGLLGILAGGSLLIGFYWLVRVRFELGRTPAFLATALLGWTANFAAWSSGGMETMAFVLLLCATFERLVLRKGGVEPISAAVCATLLGLIRVEGIEWFAVIVILAIISRRLERQRCGRQIATVVAIVAITYGTYFILRYLHFGTWVSNTAAAKVHLSNLGPWLARGFDYVAAQYLTTLPLVAVVPGIYFAIRARKERPVGLVVAAMSLGFPAYAILVSGDFMPFGRFLVPGLPFICLMVAWMLHDLSRRASPRIAVALGVGLVCLGALPAWDYCVVPKAVRSRFDFRFAQPRGFPYPSELEEVVRQRKATQGNILRGRALAAISAPGESVVIGAIGGVGYYSRLHIYDRFGLVTTEVAKHPWDGKVRTHPGHDLVVDVRFFLRERPTYLLVERLMDRREDAVKWLRTSVQETLDHARAGDGGALRGPLTEHDLAVQARYLPDFARVRVASDPELERYLVFLRRIPDAADLDASWAELRERVARFADRGEARTIDLP